MSLFQFRNSVFLAFPVALFVSASSNGCSVQQDVGTSRQGDSGDDEEGTSCAVPRTSVLCECSTGEVNGSRRCNDDLTWGKCVCPGSANPDASTAQGCAKGQTCGDSSTPEGMKRFFVTAATFAGNFGGAGGADEKCVLAAEGASLGGTWRALLGGDPLDHLADVGPWFMLDGTKVFNNRAQIVAGLPLKSLCVNERSEDQCMVNGGNVWTGASTSCRDWSTETDSASYGYLYSVSEWWAAGTGLCSNRFHLYCIEQ